MRRPFRIRRPPRALAPAPHLPLCDGPVAVPAVAARMLRCTSRRGAALGAAVRTGAASLVTRSCCPTFTCSCVSPFQRFRSWLETP